MGRYRWHAWGRFVTAAAGAGLFVLFAFVLRHPVPVFDWVDLGIHELGHMVVPAPRMLHMLAGSAVQVLVPLGLASYFLWKQEDPAGGGFCLAWAGASAWDVSVYIADAPTQALPLVGGGTHDWAYLLGPQGWNALEQTGSLAGFVDFLGLALALTGIGAAVSPALSHAAAVVAARRAPAPFEPADLPVREASDPIGPPVPFAAGSLSLPDDPSPASPPVLVDDPDGDPWLVASRLPFFAGSPEDGAS